MPGTNRLKETQFTWKAALRPFRVCPFSWTEQEMTCCAAIVHAQSSFEWFAAWIRWVWRSEREDSRPQGKKVTHSHKFIITCFIFISGVKIPAGHSLFDQNAGKSCFVGFISSFHEVWLFLHTMQRWLQMWTIFIFHCISTLMEGCTQTRDLLFSLERGVLECFAQVIFEKKFAVAHAGRNPCHTGTRQNPFTDTLTVKDVWPAVIVTMKIVLEIPCLWSDFMSRPWQMPVILTGSPCKMHVHALKLNYIPSSTVMETYLLSLVLHYARILRMQMKWGINRHPFPTELLTPTSITNHSSSPSHLQSIHEGYWQQTAEVALTAFINKIFTWTLCI